MTTLDTHEISLTCPKCGHETKKSVGWLKANNKFTCGGCNSAVNLDTDKLLGSVRESEALLGGFGNRIKSLNSSMKRR